MINSASPVPDWRTYADQIVTRLALFYLPHDDSPDASAADTDSWLDEPSDIAGGTGRKVDPTSPVTTPQSPLQMLLATPGYPHLPPDVIEDLRAAGLDPEATLITGETRPARPLPMRELAMAIRLAASFGDETALRAACQHGAITLLTGVAPAELGSTAELIGRVMLPQGVHAATELRRDTPPEFVLILTPAPSGDEISGRSREMFQDAITRVLASQRPLILLVPDAHCLPEPLRKAIPSMHRLASLGREILIAHLRHSHSATGRIDEAAVRALLPEDHHLAMLDPTALALALRQPTARAVAECVAALCVSVPKSGPDLEAMTGDSPALLAARRMIADLRLWQTGEIGWNDLSRSLLLYGPPGTGKTWLARAMGNSAGIAMVSGSFAEWQSAGHLGDMLREMRKTFAEARRLTPSLLFIDEIDAVGSRSDGERHNSNYRVQVINGFLAEMDSIAHEAGVIVVAACNHPERIDPAVLRAGRFDLKVPVPLPDAFTIQGILREKLGNLFTEEELHDLTRGAAGQSAAQIDAAVRAARSEARHAERALSPQDVLAQLGGSGADVQNAVDHRIAVHECGHALVAAALNRGKVTRILITPDGGEIHRREPDSAGLCSDHEAELAVLLAGRTAECLIFGEVSSGAGGSDQSDLARATRIALALDTQLGLGQSGTLWCDLPPELALRDPAIRASVKRRLDRAEVLATEILTALRARLGDMARALQQNRELSEADVAAWLAPLLAGRPAGDDDRAIAVGLWSDPEDAAVGTSPGDTIHDQVDRSDSASAAATKCDADDDPDTQNDQDGSAMCQAIQIPEQGN